MAPLLAGEDVLRRLFSGVTEQTFEVELGIAEPPLIEYMVNMLLRFLRQEAIYRVRDTTGHRLTQVADMVEEAEHRQARPRREIHRHIGDFTLFFSGVFPEHLPRLQAPDRKDYLLDYCRQGKRSYLIAASYAEDDEAREEAPVLRLLSEEFELCSEGLHRVRRELDLLPQLAKRPADLN
ncbi:MAG TPA: hypothetical protein VK137_05230 [Planctomycetaceae bacterium]|nr:hypothetical protein [Planctomycetaceae bacterium]